MIAAYGTINHNLKHPDATTPTSSPLIRFPKRLNTLHIAKAAGLSLCSGGIFGMGEDWDDRIDMMLMLRDIGVDVMPINFLNPLRHARWRHQPKMAPMECLKIISVARFLHPRRN